MGQDGVTWVAVYQSTSEEDCRVHALVLRAAGIAHEVRRESGELTILVAPSNAERSREELQAYAVENRGSPAVRRPTAAVPRGWSGVVGFVIVLLLVALLQQQHAWGVDWLEAGRTHAGLIRQGQWWRTVTALTLHVDGVHLLSNLVAGCWFGLFVGQSLGSGLAWLSILMAGAAGNLINAWTRPPQHTSVGASTAVFAALGLLAALAWQSRQRPRTSRMERWAPLVGGVVLLSLLGTGGANTDIPAHMFGFLCGVLLGMLHGKLGHRPAFASRARFPYGIAALGVLVAAWTLALRQHDL